MKRNITMCSDDELEFQLHNSPPLVRLLQAGRYKEIVDMVKRCFGYTPTQFTNLLIALVEHKDNHRIDGAQ